MSAEIFNKYALGVVAIISMVVGPWLQWRIAKRQAKLQEDIAARQAALQEAIAKRQVADSIAGRRQIWINELRTDVARFLMLCEHMADVYSIPLDSVHEQMKEDDLDKVFDAAREATEISARISLRMNVHEEMHEHLQRALGHLHATTRSITHGESRNENAVWVHAKQSVVVLTRSILKSEWERVKHGDL